MAGGCSGTFGGRIRAIGEAAMSSSSTAHLKNAWSPA
jgi:hypothetical protein